METEVQRIAAAQASRWNLMQVEVTPRGTPRLPQFKKNFGEDVQVTIRDPQTGQRAPFLLRSGRVLMARECLPERADLALDEEGCMVDQATFEQRWRQYLDSYVMPADSNPHFEPVPLVTSYLNAKPDEWTVSKGMVEIDFDPTAGGEFVPQFYVDHKGESIPVEEYERKEREKAERDDRMERLLMALGEKMIGEDTLPDKPIVTPEEVEAVVKVEEQRAAVQPIDQERAPCGKFVKSGYVKQHIRHCKDEACHPGDEAA